jgi:uncharacterized membrane protein YkvA (DUF1232 family)
MNLRLALLCFIYVVSPIDLVPEVALGPLGLGDDVIAGLIGLRSLIARK